MARYFMELAYKGTNYHGWQIQPNGISIQEALEKALGTIFSTNIDITGAGRTDAGVHAAYMVAHFDTEQPILDCNKLTNRLNRILPNDIAVMSVSEVAADSHSRFSAISRKYEYHITFEKNPFLFGLAHKVNYNLDFDLMNEAAATLLLYNDFTSFSKLHSDVKNNLCTVTQSFWQERDNKWVYTIEANRFLRNMVRAIVGTLLDVGRTKITTNQFIEIIEAKDRSFAGTSAPPQGLYLVDIKYPEDVFMKVSSKTNNLVTTNR